MDPQESSILPSFEKVQRYLSSILFPLLVWGLLINY